MFVQNKLKNQSEETPSSSRQEGFRVITLRFTFRIEVIAYQLAVNKAHLFN